MDRITGEGLAKACFGGDTELTMRYHFQQLPTSEKLPLSYKFLSKFASDFGNDVYDEEEKAWFRTVRVRLNQVWQRQKKSYLEGVLREKLQDRVLREILDAALYFYFYYPAWEYICPELLCAALINALHTFYKLPLVPTNSRLLNAFDEAEKIMDNLCGERDFTLYDTAVERMLSWIIIMLPAVEEVIVPTKGEDEEMATNESAPRAEDEPTMAGITNMLEDDKTPQEEIAQPPPVPVYTYSPKRPTYFPPRCAIHTQADICKELQLSCDKNESILLCRLNFLGAGVPYEKYVSLRQLIVSADEISIRYKQRDDMLREILDKAKRQKGEVQVAARAALGISYRVTRGRQWVCDELTEILESLLPSRSDDEDDNDDGSIGRQFLELEERRAQFDMAPVEARWVQMVLAAGKQCQLTIRQNAHVFLPRRENPCVDAKATDKTVQLLDDAVSTATDLLDYYFMNESYALLDGFTVGLAVLSALAPHEPSVQNHARMCDWISKANDLQLPGHKLAADYFGLIKADATKYLEQKRRGVKKLTKKQRQAYTESLFSQLAKCYYVRPELDTVLEELVAEKDLYIAGEDQRTAERFFMSRMLAERRQKLLADEMVRLREELGVSFTQDVEQFVDEQYSGEETKAKEEAKKRVEVRESGDNIALDEDEEL